MRHIILKTFTGPFALIEMYDGSLRTSWVDAHTKELLTASKRDPALRPELVARLHGYFDGKTVDFSDVELGTATPFLRRCWEACRRIPRGVTITYAQLAARAGSPNAFRAAGQAMRNNRLPIIVPCHRVVGSGGTLHGFGGTVDSGSAELSIKRRLLEMEGALADEECLSAPARRRKRTPELTPA